MIKLDIGRRETENLMKSSIWSALCHNKGLWELQNNKSVTVLFYLESCRNFKAEKNFPRFKKSDKGVLSIKNNICISQGLETWVTWE